ncbi:MAG: XdhC/CoxF family protein [Gammaproteobacteria bacterium]|nr:XdhC/CoxF family protein [Gammaproteobacteria bacterium]NIR84924.1 XdhC/CoxF family protein [Gammaproteobacteria bacterium]NIR91773.1 XdhC/CoxF family protein [Gammaproteobacteria bacterium]NIU05971.1 XdhC/CoxF family protein [Gammaproteobacteria bacterium]NIV53018.1 xanthine dehydrogenase [Gammaproteobacteria bacterium]
MRGETLDALLAARAARRPVVLMTLLDTGEQWLLEPAGEGALPAFARAAATGAQQALADDRSNRVETPQGTVFIHVFNPPPRMIIVGAVHIAQSLAPMAGLAGFDVTVVDPRRAFASDQRFPSVSVQVEWADEVLERLAPDARTAVVTLTHDPKLDDPALSAALRSEAFYVGALGSRRTHAARLERLAQAGFGDAELARIHGPAGLDIGARTPAEIALAIVAQATQALHRGAA